MAKEQQIRTIAHAVIRRVLLEAPGQRRQGPHTALEAALDAAYPFGLRRGTAYEIWRDECRRAANRCSAA